MLSFISLLFTLSDISSTKFHIETTDDMSLYILTHKEYLVFFLKIYKFIYTWYVWVCK